MPNRSISRKRWNRRSALGNLRSWKNSCILNCTCNQSCCCWRIWLRTWWKNGKNRISNRPEDARKEYLCGGYQFYSWFNNYGRRNRIIDQIVISSEGKEAISVTKGLSSTFVDKLLSRVDWLYGEILWWICTQNFYLQVPSINDGSSCKILLGESDETGSQKNSECFNNALHC